jgi:hypothetical protein
MCMCLGRIFTSGPPRLRKCTMMVKWASAKAPFRSRDLIRCGLLRQCLGMGATPMHGIGPPPYNLRQGVRSDAVAVPLRFVHPQIPRDIRMLMKPLGRSSPAPVLSARVITSSNRRCDCEYIGNRVHKPNYVHFVRGHPCWRRLRYYRTDHPVHYPGLPHRVHAHVSMGDTYRLRP